MNANATTGNDELLKVYWQPGCSSCLRTKEFLTKHGVPFVSINVLTDREAFDDLARLGVRRVPIVRRGGDWVDGQILKDLARIAGIRWDAPALALPADLVAQTNTVFTCAQRLLATIPENQLDALLPDRPRSYRQLAAHIFQIIEAFLDLVEHGRRVEFATYNQEVPAHITSGEELVRFGKDVQKRFNAWWKSSGPSTDMAARADVYTANRRCTSSWNAASGTRHSTPDSCSSWSRNLGSLPTHRSPSRNSRGCRSPTTFGMTS